MTGPLRLAVCLKQVPAFESMTLGPDGRLVRDGLALEMNPYCRRAVAKAVELAATHGGDLTFLTLGPDTARDALYEALAWADQHGAAATGILVTDPACAGSDTLATARALESVVRSRGPFDLVLMGRNSVDADTGQVGPELAALLDLPFAAAVRDLTVANRSVHARCEYDDGTVDLEFELPGVISCAERLCDPCKVPPNARRDVLPARIEVLTATDLGPGPWGAAGSPTRVGPTRILEVPRARVMDANASLDDQIATAVKVLAERAALRALAPTPSPPVAETGGTGPEVVVIVEPDRAHLTRELLGEAARLAATRNGSVTAITVSAADVQTLASWGADHVVELLVANVEFDVATGVTEYCTRHAPWVVLAPSTVWGREVASRAAAHLGAGLTGDAVSLEIGDDGRLIAWKPAFGGQLVAAISATSPTQMATVRPGTLRTLSPRSARARVEQVSVASHGRVHVVARQRNDDVEELADAQVVVGVGRGVDPNEYPALDGLRGLLGAELAATRKVTDAGWLPRARQIGITGRSIAPRLFVSIGAGGKFNHSIGIRGAGTVLAINADAAAPIFDHCDVGIVADWHDAVPRLVAALGG